MRPRARNAHTVRQGGAVPHAGVFCCGYEGVLYVSTGGGGEGDGTALKRGLTREAALAAND